MLKDLYYILYSILCLAINIKHSLIIYTSYMAIKMNIFSNLNIKTFHLKRKARMTFFPDSLFTLCRTTEHLSQP
jgi:hypothetical protein